MKKFISSFYILTSIIILSAGLLLFSKQQHHEPPFIIRAGTITDIPELIELYKAVASQPGGLARTPEEITESYIRSSVEAAQARGLIFVAEEQGKLIGCLHKYTPEVNAFSHMLSEGNMAVHPDYHRQGVGLALFKRFLEEIETHKPAIKLVKLTVRASNIGAIKLYQRIGFEIKATLEDHIQGADGSLEDDLIMCWINTNYHGKN